MNVDYHLAEFDEADYEAIVRIAKAVRPDDFISVEDLTDWDNNQRRAGRRSSRWVASIDAEAVGYASLGESPWLNAELRYSNISVVPDHQGRGIGRSLLGRVEDLAEERGAQSLLTSTEDYRRREIKFLEAARFVEIDRDWQSTLDLSAFDPDQWNEAIANVTSSGIRIVPVAELRDTVPDWIDRLHQLYIELEGDMPVKVPIQPVSRGDFEALMLGRRMLAAGFLVALDGDDFVGLTQPDRVDGEPDVLSQEMTGVAAKARGRGIATALKVAAAIWAKDAGYRSVRTYNAASNAPMLAVNGKIGFVKDHGFIEFRKDL